MALKGGKVSPTFVGVQLRMAKIYHLKQNSTKRYFQDFLKTCGTNHPQRNSSLDKLMLVLGSDEHQSFIKPESQLAQLAELAQQAQLAQPVRLVQAVQLAQLVLRVQPDY